MPFIDVCNRRIEYVRIEVAPAGRPTLVFLHEGIGSIAMWRDFPARVAHAAGCNALVYSRYGYGNSEPLHEARDVRYMHDEALAALPELLDKLALERPVLVGHSDGASIALIHAGGAGRPVAGLVVLAPHVLVEDISVASIEAAKVAYETTNLRERLARYHADVDSAFWGWNRIWLASEFRLWNIEDYLPRITCPVLAIQGGEDEYGTMEQLRRIAAKVADAELVDLADCRHSPHKDQPDAVVAAITRFVDRLASPVRGPGLHRLPRFT
jgi:pimeloyl-ACP methyl ester carboxylesterase